MIERIIEAAIAGVEEVRQAEEFSQISREILLVKNNPALRQDVDKETRKNINRARDIVRNIDAGLIRSCLVIKICAVFESFIRSLIEVHLTRFESGNIIVPEILVGTNIAFSGRLLANYDKGDKSRDFNHQELIRNLHEFLHDEVGGPVNKTAITAFLGACNFNGVGEIFKKVGIPKLWDEVAKSKDVQRAVQSRAVRETKKLIHSKLDQYVAIRNDHAHGVDGSEIVSQQQFREAVQFYIAIVTAIGEVVQGIQLVQKN